MDENIMNEIVCLEQSDALYPDLLRLIASPPQRIYCIGNLELLKKEKVSVVGSRKTTPYGKWAAYNLAKNLSECDVVTVSGLAFGIDAEAHKGALTGLGGTIAVMASGVDVCSPVGNMRLRENMLKSGKALIISEFEPGALAQKYTFPIRNRIISGLSLATVIVEAGIKSGSLITANHAIDQGRDVYAVPGNMDRHTSYGCNKLIKDGAEILVSFDDVLRMSSSADLSQKEKKLLESLGSEEEIIYKTVLQKGESSIDEIAFYVGMSSVKVAGLVTIMEIKGLLCHAYGKVFIEN